MTKSLLLFSLISLLFIACGDKPKPTDPSPDAINDSRNGTDTAPSNSSSTQELEELQKQHDAFTDLFGKNQKDLECKEREAIKELNFDGITPEVTEAKRCAVTEKEAIIQFTYFDGSPIGGKRFFLSVPEQLIAVEVFTFEEEETETGLAIAEVPIAIFYYKNDKLLKALGPDGQEPEADISALQQETEKEWAAMKKDFFTATFHKTVNG